MTLELPIGVGSSCSPVAMQVHVNKTTSVIPTASVIHPIIIIINRKYLEKDPEAGPASDGWTISVET